MTEPHHVALVHDGRVLVDETGALPSFVPSQHLGSLTRPLPPGWFDLVEAWIDSVPAGSGGRRTGPIEAVKMWSISAVARVGTDGGDRWLKAPCEHFMAEASVHSVVERLFPDLVRRELGGVVADRLCTLPAKVAELR